MIKILLELFVKKNLAFKTGEEVISTFQNFVQASLTHMGNKITQCETRADAIKSFEMSSFEINNAMKTLNTANKVKTAADHLGYYEDPKSFVIRNEIMFLSEALQEKITTGTIMPIKHQVKCFLEYSEESRGFIE